MPDKLSGGMRKRVGLARTIVGRPHCILYDEPTTGLDPVTSDSINHLIRRLQKRLQVTSVVVTHDMKTAFHTADHVVFLHEGRCYFDGTVADLRATTDPVMTVHRRPIRKPISAMEHRGPEIYVGLFADRPVRDRGDGRDVRQGRAEPAKSYQLTVEFPNATGLVKARTFCSPAHASDTPPAHRI
jgi:ABC-type multidrug transport system ATPase subunit